MMNVEGIVGSNSMVWFGGISIFILNINADVTPLDNNDRSAYKQAKINTDLQDGSALERLKLLSEQVKDEEMKEIQFSKEERADISRRIQNYFADELDHEIGNIPAEMLLLFFSKEFGKYYYNQGLRDAQAVLASKIDEFDDAVYGLEQVTEFR